MIKVKKAWAILTPHGLRLGKPDPSLKPGSRVYITTDGIIDQIGGPKQIAFGKKRLKSHHGMRQQIDGAAKSPHHGHLYKYQGEHLRRDDVSILVSVWIKPGCWVH